MSATISNCPPGRRWAAARPTGAADAQPVCGRAAEQRIAGTLLDRAAQGAAAAASCVLLVDGEPGIGKSLLLRDCACVAAGRGFSLATGTADQLGQTIPFFPLLTALRQPLTGCEPQLDDSGDAVPARIGALHDHLIERAAVAPVLITVDDLQWADHATLLALRVLPGQLARHPVAWVLARSGTPGGRDADLLFDVLLSHGATRLILGPLGDEAVTDLLTAAFGGPPDGQLLALAAGAAGNPAVLAELIEGLRDDKAVQVTGGQAGLVSAGLPARVNRVARHRLAGLSDQAQHLLRTAAALGGPFRLPDMAEMLGVTPAQLLPLVEETLAAGIVVADEAAFSFRQPLLGHALGEMVPRPARSALHRQFGEILLRRGEAPAAAASHLLEAAAPGDGMSLAGLDDAAAELLPTAPQAAARLAVRALDLTQPGAPAALDIPATRARAVAAAEALTAAGQFGHAASIIRHGLAQPLPPVAEARFRCALATILAASGEPELARAEAETALAAPDLPDGLRDAARTAQLQALAGVPGPAGQDADRLAAAILADPAQHSGQAVTAALLAVALIRCDEGQVSDGIELLHEAARQGRAVSPDARQAQPLLVAAATLADLGRYGEAEKVIQGIDRDTVRGIPADAVLSILAARHCLAHGDLSRAAAAARAAVAAAGEAPGYASLGHCLLGLIALRQGDLAAAAQHLASRPAPATQLAASYARTAARLTEAMLAAAGEGPAAAIGHIRAACVHLQRRPGILLGDPGIPAWLVRTALAAGQDDLAAEVARAASALAHASPDMPALTAAAAQCQGLLTHDPAQLADAAAQHTDPWAQASAAEDLAVLLASQASKDQAITRLHEAMAGYARAGASTDMARIRGRLRRLGVRRRYWTASAGRPLTGWASLTDAERATAQLAAQGLNNRQIGGRLYISRHTVAFHLRQIFRKLQISSRVQLTRIVVEQDQPH
jgi:DNA-binding CsgD family transcriptional regulator